MGNEYLDVDYEELIKKAIHEEMSQLIVRLTQTEHAFHKKYVTMEELATITGIGTYTLRQLTFASAPHRRVKSRLIFDQTNIL